MVNYIPAPSHTNGKLADIAFLAPLPSHQSTDSNSHNRHILQKVTIVASGVELFDRRFGLKEQSELRIAMTGFISEGPTESGMRPLRRALLPRTRC
jgi:hypothetical protein